MDVGLTETEATIYLAGVETEAITVQQIGTATGIKRPTIYHALRTLTEKGLASEQQLNGKTYIRMQEPSRLLEWIERQKEGLDEKEAAVRTLVAQLVTRTQEGAHDDTKVVHYADNKSVHAVFDLAFYARTKRCVLIFPSHDALEGFDEGGARMRAARERGIEVCIEIRKHIESALVIYDETVVLLSVRTHPSVTVITSLSLARTLSSLF